MGPAPDALPVGLYEDLVTLRIRERVAGLAAERGVFSEVEDAEQPHLLGRHVAAVVEWVLDGVRPADRVRVANEVLAALATAAGAAELEDSHLAVLEGGRSQLLLEVLGGGLGAIARRRPQLPLRRTDLLVNGRGEPRLAHEVAAEIASAERVDLLCAFLKWSGLQLVEDALIEAIARGVRVRVLTTTYVGATEARAVDRLVELGAEVRISYEVLRTRLHAKGLAVHPGEGARHRLCGLFQPVPGGDGRRPGVERPGQPGREPGGAHQVRLHLRGLLARPQLRRPRPGGRRRPPAGRAAAGVDPGSGGRGWGEP